MPGDEWQKFANLRLLYSYMYGHPGAKLIFMGGEFAQSEEWSHDSELNWEQSEKINNSGIGLLLKDLNNLYISYPSLYKCNYSPDGFTWIDYNDSMNSVLVWIRKYEDEELIFVANFTPVPRHNYRIGVPLMGCYDEIFNSDDRRYGGGNIRNENELETSPIKKHGQIHSLSLVLPPLAIIILKHNEKNILQGY